MRRVWNIILLPLLTFLGTLIAPQYVMVEEPINYLWLFLLQIPASIIVALIMFVLMLILVKIAMEWSPVVLIIVAVITLAIFAMAAEMGMLILIDKWLPGVQYNGFWTYFLFALVFGLLSAGTNVQTGNNQK